jgi:hypothetical protein
MLSKNNHWPTVVTKKRNRHRITEANEQGFGFGSYLSKNDKKQHFNKMDAHSIVLLRDVRLK